jgi:uncharacterized protein (DUF1330 family)
MPTRAARDRTVRLLRDAGPLTADEVATDHFEFTKTRVVVKLFALGARFVSRSEARRVVNGVDRFREVVLDYRNVQEIGQGFADELYRVWAASHRAIKVSSVHMNQAVAFMVRRAGGR